MFVIKLDSPRCELPTGTDRIKQAHKFNYLGSVVADDEKMTEIQRCIRIAS